jgi:heme A synthase
MGWAGSVSKQLTRAERLERRSAAARGNARGFRVFAVLTTVVAYLEIVLGGTVRATGSGLACPDWPTCHGRLVPSLSQHVLIEYSHRLSASVVSICVVLLAIAALWIWPQRRYLKVLSLVALGLLILQVVLGGITVLLDLPPEIVTAHLATATILLGVLATISVYSFTGRSANLDPVARRFSRTAMIAAGGVFLLILTGSYVVGSDAGLACHTWPLCNGQVLPTGGHQAVDINFLHRMTAVVIGLAIASVALRAWLTRRGNPALLWGASAALLVYCSQVLVGAGNVWFGLAAGIQIAHLATAEALWLVTAVLAVLAAAGPRRAAAQVAPLVRRGVLPAPSPDRRPRFGDRARRDEDNAVRREVP